MRFFKKFPTKLHDIDPDQIFLDASNLPHFDRHQFEGRLEKPINKKMVWVVGVFAVVVAIVFLGRLWNLQVAQGAQFRQLAENNSLHSSIIFAPRGVIYDRNGVPLAWNNVNPNNPEVPLREYATSTGLGSLLGYIKYPTRDTSGDYYRQDYVGITGAEKYFNTQLTGQNGSELAEETARGTIVSRNVVEPPQPGKNITLSIDSRVQAEMYKALQDIAAKIQSPGGAGMIINIHTGEVIAAVSFPSYNPQIMSDGTNTVAIHNYFTDPATPLLDRLTNGLYAPGSIVKPVMAMGALDTRTVAANTIIQTHGYITVPDPYNPAIIYRFNDWRNNGALDIAHAIGFSSDAYFYIVGGGYQNQKGMGIANIDKYAHLFGYGEQVPGFFAGPAGVVPSPAWKATAFKNDPWSIGDTYHSVIGQFGWQVTPVQVLRAITAIANDGTLLTPTILKGDTNALSTAVHLSFPQSYYNAIHYGMRLSATIGTGNALNVSYVQFATKTGTAQLGVNNDMSNSWTGGFWPYQNPQYAFVMMLERRPRKYVLGSFDAARELFDWMDQHTPEYFASTTAS